MAVFRYYFRLTKTSERAGSYSEIMKDECAKINMKPLCDHPTYCKNNADAIYIGQSKHMAHKPDRVRNDYYPSGWGALRRKFPERFCTYTDHHGGHDKALCTEGGEEGKHEWRTPAYNNVFMCASLAKPVIGRHAS